MQFNTNQPTNQPTNLNVASEFDSLTVFPALQFPVPILNQDSNM